MNVVLARIDDRFIHGQVTVGWSQKLRPDHIILSNNEIAADPWQARVYRSAVPPEMRVSILNTSQTVAALNSEDGSSSREERSILLVGDPNDMLFVQRHGSLLREINVGGMHYAEGKRKLLPFVYVDPQDLSAFRSLLTLGCRLVAQQLPGSKETEIDLSLLVATEKMF
jgi:mannose/fructose/N-acetylgalactosamine-specific phosphotransferase system component IIB